MNDENTSEAVEKPALRVWDLVTSCYGLVYYRFKAFVHIIWIPTLISALLSWRTAAQFAEAMSIDTQTENGVAQFAALQLNHWSDPLTYLYMAAMWGSLAAAFVAVHRLVLLDEEPPRPLGISIGMRELRYCGYGLVAYVVTILPFLLIGVVMVGLQGLLGGGSMPTMASILFFVLLLGSVIFLIMALLRFGLMFPAVAIDEAHGVRSALRSAWDLARGRTLGLFLAPFLASLPFGILGFLVSKIFTNGVGIGAPLTAGGVAVLFFNAVGTTTLYFISMAIFSRAYQILSQVPTVQEPLAEDARSG